jgi:cob(I)alamin adenosyltransferase
MKKYYSSRGDDGTSSVMDGQRVDKNSPVFELLGTLDEACAALNMAVLQVREKKHRELIGAIQMDLKLIMAEAAGDKTLELKSEKIAWLEMQIEKMGEGVLMPDGFITTWEKPSSAMLNFARTVVRRAERAAVAYLQSQGNSNGNWVAYLNRLSSLLFILQLLMENPPIKG